MNRSQAPAFHDDSLAVLDQHVRPRRDFTTSASNTNWLTDITKHPTRESKVFCAAATDASADASSPSIDSQQDRTLVDNVLDMAIRNSRTPRSRARQLETASS